MKYLSLLFFLFATNIVSAQVIFEEPEGLNSDSKKFISSVYGELGGAGVVMSINYDLVINNSSVFRIGATPTILSDPNSKQVNEQYDDEDFPIVGIVSYSKLFGKNDSRVEVGAGFTFGDTISYADKPGSNALFGNISYRLQPVDGKTIFRATFNPFLKDGNIVSWIGLSFGYSF